MQTLGYRVRFTTPAFLGNAEQNGQWRTPPFKALLRQWWRVVHAADREFDVRVDQMRREEGLLFGNAWLTHDEGSRTVSDYCQSRVRIRLNRWSAGKLRSWNRLEGSPVCHPEVQRAQHRIGPQAYLGYGPLDARRGTRLAKPNAAIQAGETAKLLIAVPDRHTEEIQAAFALMNAYGTIGGRSRNGWGSFVIDPESDIAPEPDRNSTTPPTLSKFCRDWRDALNLDWAHAIGRDQNANGQDRALVWQTNNHKDWQSVMRELAIIRIGLRTMFVFPKSRGHAKPLDRHWLSYPVTNHAVKAWRGFRLPNSLRFKVRPDAEEPQKLRGVIVHVPCKPPLKLDYSELRAINSVWERVHKLLDTIGTRRSLDMIEDEERRRRLEPTLSGVRLQRIQS